MPLFKYTAINPKGRKVSGEADAANETELHLQLSRIGLTITHMKEEGVETPLLNRRISPAELMWVCKQFHYSLSAGLDIMSALDSIKITAGDVRIRGALAGVEMFVRQGDKLAEAFASFPKLFNSFFVSCVAAGEKSGNLPFVFIQLAEYYQRQIEFRRRLVKSLRYPLITMMFTSGMIFLLLAHIFYLLIHHSLTVPPDVLKSLLISPLSVYCFDTILSVTATCILTRFFYRRYEAFARIIDAVLLKTPWIGDLLRTTDLARFSLFLAMLYECGIPIAEGVEFSGRVINNRIIQDDIRTIALLVKKGVPPAEAFLLMNKCPEVIGNALKVGEHTGNFEDPLREAARLCRIRVEDALDAFCQYLKPALLAFSGFMLLDGIF